MDFLFPSQCADTASECDAEIVYPFTRSFRNVESYCRAWSVLLKCTANIFVVKYDCASGGNVFSISLKHEIRVFKTGIVYRWKMIYSSVF